MKLSEAIVLGSTMIRLDPCNWYLPSEQCGCLIGMAIAGSGFQCADEDGMTNPEVISAYPWLAEPVPFGMLPAQNEGRHWNGSAMPRYCFGSVISSLAHSVFEREMTLEQAVEWIRSVEPQDERTDGGQGPVAAALEVQAV